jgi:transcriptional regulator with XRE-family HTH domain
MTQSLDRGLGPNVEVYGERLRDARVIQRLRSGVVAELAGFSADRYSRLETSFSSSLTLDRAERLAKALNFPLAYLSASR